jgi:hypothetical protein
VINTLGARGAAAASPGIDDEVATQQAQDVHVQVVG